MNDKLIAQEQSGDQSEDQEAEPRIEQNEHEAKNITKSLTITASNPSKRWTLLATAFTAIWIVCLLGIVLNWVPHSFTEINSPADYSALKNWQYPVPIELVVAIDQSAAIARVTFSGWCCGDYSGSYLFQVVEWLKKPAGNSTDVLTYGSNAEQQFPLLATWSKDFVILQKSIEPRSISNQGKTTWDTAFFAIKEGKIIAGDVPGYEGMSVELFLQQISSIVNAGTTPKLP